MSRDVPLEQDAGHISRGADSNPSLTTLVHPISFLAEPEDLSADGLRCVFMPFRHSISHNCSAVHNGSLGEVPRIHLCAVLVSAAPLRFLFSLHKNMLYSVTFVYYTISFSVCFFLPWSSHCTQCIDRCLCGKAKWPDDYWMHWMYFACSGVSFSKQLKPCFQDQTGTLEIFQNIVSIYNCCVFVLVSLEAISLLQS